MFQFRCALLLNLSIYHMYCTVDVPFIGFRSIHKQSRSLGAAGTRDDERWDRKQTSGWWKKTTRKQIRNWWGQKEQEQTPVHLGLPAPPASTTNRLTRWCLSLQLPSTSYSTVIFLRYNRPLFFPFSFSFFSFSFSFVPLPLSRAMKGGTVQYKCFRKRPAR